MRRSSFENLEGTKSCSYLAVSLLRYLAKPNVNLQNSTLIASRAIKSGLKLRHEIDLQHFNINNIKIVRLYQNHGPDHPIPIHLEQILLLGSGSSCTWPRVDC